MIRRDPFAGALGAVVLALPSLAFAQYFPPQQGPLHPNDPRLRGPGYDTHGSTFHGSDGYGGGYADEYGEARLIDPAMGDPGFNDFRNLPNVNNPLREVRPHMRVYFGRQHAAALTDPAAAYNYDTNIGYQPTPYGQFQTPEIWNGQVDPRSYANPSFQAYGADPAFQREYQAFAHQAADNFDLGFSTGYQQQQGRGEGVVTQIAYRGLPLRSGPGRQHPMLTTVMPGTRVNVLSQRNGYYQITAPGFVEARSDLVQTVGPQFIRALRTVRVSGLPDAGPVVAIAQPGQTMRILRRQSGYFVVPASAWVDARAIQMSYGRSLGPDGLPGGPSLDPRQPLPPSLDPYADPFRVTDPFADPRLRDPRLEDPTRGFTDLIDGRRFAGHRIEGSDPLDRGAGRQYYPSSGRQAGSMRANESELEILARICKGEATSCPYEGKVAVVAVILNRVRHRSFPNTIRGVAHQPKQFSCYNANMRQRLYYGRIPADCMRAAREALSGRDPVNGATHYFNPFLVNPSWARRLRFVRRIGSTRRDAHDFYIQD